MEGVGMRKRSRAENIWPRAEEISASCLKAIKMQALHYFTRLYWFDKR